jgi:hypothetical protein
MRAKTRHKKAWMCWNIQATAIMEIKIEVKKGAYVSCFFSDIMQEIRKVAEIDKCDNSFKKDYLIELKIKENGGGNNEKDIMRDGIA